MRAVVVPSHPTLQRVARTTPDVLVAGARAIRVPAEVDLVARPLLGHAPRLRGPVTTLTAGVCASVAMSLVPAVARAVPPPADLPIGPGVTLSVTVGDGTSHLDLRASGRSVEAWDVPFVLADIATESESSAGRAVIVLRGRGSGSAEIAAVIDARPRPHLVWRGRLDLHGDPGERVADALERRDIDGDDRIDLVVGQRREGVAPCGETPQLLFARALDARGQLRAVQPVLAATGTPLVAGQPPAEPRSPIVRALRFTASSSARGVDEEAVLLGPPFGLTDGDPATGWTEGRGAGGDGEVLRAQWGGPAITEITLTSPTAEAMPRGVVLRLDAEQYAVSIPPAVGALASITLPTPARPQCVSLVLADRTTRPADTQIGFVEITAYSIIDGPRGLEALVDLIVADASDGDRAVGWLASAGDRALPVLDAAWERLGARGRRRALRVAAALERSTDADVIARIRALRVRAGSDEDAEVRGDAVTALARGGDDDRAALFVIARSEPVDASLAAAALARGNGIPASAWDDVTHLEAAQWDRPALRLAVARALTRESAWQAALDDAPLDAHGLAALAIGLADARVAGMVETSASALVTRLVVRAIARPESSTDFVTRFRIARAARVTEDASIDAWLSETARHAEEWMLRAEAVESLGARASRDLLGVMLNDAYPRVRLAAARAVARRGQESATLIAIARHDAWPLVRAYALGEIADLPDARPVLIDALADPASAMRARALELLHDRTAADVDAPVIAILQDDQEWPHVAGRAVEVAEVRCSESLGPALVHAVRRGARGSASAGDLETAQVALRVALRYGGTTAAAARAATDGPSAPAFQVLLTHPQPPCAGTAGAARESSAPSTQAGVPSAE